MPNSHRLTNCFVASDGGVNWIHMHRDDSRLSPTDYTENLKSEHVQNKTKYGLDKTVLSRRIWWCKLGICLQISQVDLQSKMS